VFEPQGDEDALHCNLGHDVEFTAFPTRRAPSRANDR